MPDSLSLWASSAHVGTDAYACFLPGNPALLFQFLQGRIAAAGLDGRIQFVGIRRDIERLMLASDVFAFSLPRRKRWVAVGNLSVALRSWRQIRRRRLGPRVLHLSGTALLIMEAWGVPGRSFGGRIANKWKGWMRLRTNPELVAR